MASRKEINREQFEALCRLNPTSKDVCAFFKISEDTLTTRCKEFGYASFSDARDQNMVHTRFSLVKKALNMAQSGNVPMMIFLLKNLLDYSDQPKDSEKPIKIELSYKDEEI